MKLLIVLALFISSLSLCAETFEARVFLLSPDEGILRFENGRVAFLDGSLKSLNGFSPGVLARVKVDGRNGLRFLEILEEAPLPMVGIKSLMNQEPPPFTPTVLPNLQAAVEMFERMRPSFKRVSECSDRAHVWAHDEFINNNIMSQKVFIYFTDSYIKRNRFKWWFHVAPLIQAQEGNALQARVMDFRYAHRPLLIKEWTDMLVFSKRPCKMTTKFSEYDVNPQTEDCYMIIESMFYRLPGDIHAQETQNQYRDKFIDSEVNLSKQMAFESPVERNDQ